MTIKIESESYLAQWLAAQCDSADVVRLHRGSSEAAILRAFIRRRTLYDRDPVIKGSYIEIHIPESRDRDPLTWNFLPQKGRAMLLKCFKDRFDAELFTEVFPLAGIDSLDSVISAWMESKGIEPTDTNFQTVLKRFKRRRDRFLAAQRQRRRRATRK